MSEAAANSASSPLLTSSPPVNYSSLHIDVVKDFQVKSQRRERLTARSPARAPHAPPLHERSCSAFTVPSTVLSRQHSLPTALSQSLHSPSSSKHNNNGHSFSNSVHESYINSGLELCYSPASSNSIQTRQSRTHSVTSPYIPRAYSEPPQSPNAEGERQRSPRHFSADAFAFPFVEQPPSHINSTSLTYSTAAVNDARRNDPPLTIHEGSNKHASVVRDLMRCQDDSTLSNREGRSSPLLGLHSVDLHGRRQNACCWFSVDCSWLKRLTPVFRCTKRQRLCQPRVLKSCPLCTMRLLFAALLSVSLITMSLFLLMTTRNLLVYSNRSCQLIDNEPWQVDSSTAAFAPIANTAAGVSQNEDGLPDAFVSGFAHWLSEFLGVVPFIYYSLVSTSSASIKRLIVPKSFVSSAPTFQPNYTESRLLSLPMNFFRISGSHNSYHMPSTYPIAQHHYGHPLLPLQLGDYTDGVRQLELDVHLLPGKNGLVLYHVQLIDDHTNCYCLTECLRLVRQWLQVHSLSYPVMLMIEIKRQAYEDLNAGLNGVTCNDIYNLQVALKAVFEPDVVLLPRTVRGLFPTVSDALAYQSFSQRLTNVYNNTRPEDRPDAQEIALMSSFAQYANQSVAYGWPSLGSMLGRVMLIWLDDVFNYADRLPCITQDVASEHSLMFIAQQAMNRSYNAVFVSRNPLMDWVPAVIQRALHRGLILRSLTTTAGIERISNERHQAALQHGVHIMSSDFEPPCTGNRRVANLSTGNWDDSLLDPETKYCERLPSGWPFECHPFLAPTWCSAELSRIRRPALLTANSSI